MSPPLDTEPACPEATLRERAGHAARRNLRIEERSFEDVQRPIWDGLAAATEWATPFSSWAFHRAWWDAYGGSAHEETLVALDERDEVRAIVPLMHRHQVEPTDSATHTIMRRSRNDRLTALAATAKTVFFGASYHADYATLLAANEDVAAVADAVADHLSRDADPGHPHPHPWDAVDLRRLRCGDPAADALAAAFSAREVGQHWTLNVEREDVCPVLTLPAGEDFDGYLGTLAKKSRHEIRRKIRRAEAAGAVELNDSDNPLDELEVFIDLHQRRWGDDGLFPATPGGEASRLFFRRMFEEFGPDGSIRLAFLTVGGKRIAAGIHFRTLDGFLYYNAGVDPDARDLSPGVLMVAAYVRRAIAEGCRRVDFLRGNEPYKYEWGAVDEPIQRILVRRDIAAAKVA